MINRPASLSIRALAALTDSAIVFGVWYFAISSWGQEGTLSGTASVTAGGDKVLTGWPAILVLLVTAAFWILPEWFLGATVGKLLTGLRVRSVEGEQINLTQSLQRNLLRLVDFFPFYLTGLICAAVTPNRQRLGDLWAKTIVVRNKRSVLS